MMVVTRFYTDFSTYFLTVYMVFSVNGLLFSFPVSPASSFFLMFYMVLFTCIYVICFKKLRSRFKIVPSLDNNFNDGLYRSRSTSA